MHKTHCMVRFGKFAGRRRWHRPYATHKNTLGKQSRQWDAVGTDKEASSCHSFT